jgi:hypothetical protein
VGGKPGGGAGRVREGMGEGTTGPGNPLMERGGRGG